MNIGVYQIKNLINGKYYIGSSIHLKKRLADHMYMLKSGTHQNIYLQRSFNKHGIDNFEIQILEYGFDKDDIRMKEQKWIDELDACNMSKGFNLHTLAVGGSVKGELSNNYGNTGFKNPISKQVAQLDMVTKEVIKVWGSLREIKKNLNINITHVSNVCKFLNVTNSLKESKGYFWCYFDDISKAKQGIKFTYKEKKIVKLSLSDKSIECYESIKEASSLSGKSVNVIYDYLTRFPNRSKGYKWMYLEEYEKMESAN